METDKERQSITHHYTEKKLPERVHKVIETLPEANTATILALHGDLGAGKTTFVQELARQLGVDETVISPTFLIQKRYSIHDTIFPWKQLVHIDAYRLQSAEQLQVLDWEELVKDPSNIICIEWPENVADVLTEAHHLYFEYIDDATRQISFELQKENDE